MIPTYDHIDGLKGREPVGAILRIGRKAPGGYPTENDRFFIVSPQTQLREFKSRQGKTHVALQRDTHPEFDAYHALDPEARRHIRGNLTHAAIEDCYRVHLRAQQLTPTDRWPVHPNMAPSCIGDGENATRYYGTNDEGDDFREIACPNELCEFRQEGNRQCKPFGRIYFRPNWRGTSGPPTPLMKLVTSSWNSCANLKGFFDYIQTQAEQLGIVNPSVFGLPFSISLERKSDRRHSRAYPVMSFTPETDLIAFFVRQAKALEETGGRLELPEAVGAESDVENDADVIAADYSETTPAKPGQGALFGGED